MFVISPRLIPGAGFGGVGHADGPRTRNAGTAAHGARHGARVSYLRPNKASTTYKHRKTLATTHINFFSRGNTHTGILLCIGVLPYGQTQVSCCSAYARAIGATQPTVQARG